MRHQSHQSHLPNLAPADGGDGQAPETSAVAPGQNSSADIILRKVLKIGQWEGCEPSRRPKKRQQDRLAETTAQGALQAAFRLPRACCWLHAACRVPLVCAARCLLLAACSLPLAACAKWVQSFGVEHGMYVQNNTADGNCTCTR